MASSTGDPDPDLIAGRLKPQFGDGVEHGFSRDAGPAARKSAPRTLLLVAAFLAVGIFFALRFMTRDAVRVVATGEVAAPALQSEQPMPVPAPLHVPDESARSTASAGSPNQTPETPTRSTSARVMRVMVTDQDLRPMPGALVEYFAREGSRISTTDAGGECRVELDPEDQNVQMQVIAEGYLHARGYWGYRPQQQVKLRRLIALSGRVLDAQTHTPVPFAVVSWIPDCCRGCNPLAVAADGDGRYLFEGVPFDVVKLRVEAAGYPQFQGIYQLNVAGESAERDLALPRGIAVHGRVVDFSSGAALPGATVSQGATKLVADESGAFEGLLLSPTSEPIQLKIECQGRCQLLARLGAEDLAQGASLEFRLPDSPIIEGVVYDPAGRPAADAGVSVVFNDGNERKARNSGTPPPASPLSTLPRSWTLRNSDASRVRTDAKGAFRVVGLVPWLEFHDLLATHEGFDASQSRLGRLPGPGERLVKDALLKNARTDGPGSVSGHVYLNGLLAPVNVSWRTSNSFGEAGATPIGYQSEKLPPGPVELRALVEGCAGAVEGDTASVEIAPGKNVVHDFDVRVASTTVRGHVQFTHGGPAARASVTLSMPFWFGRNVNWMQSRQETRTAEDGSFSLDVPACALELRVVAKLDAGMAFSDGVRPGDADVRLSIPASGTLLFRVLDARTSERLDPRSLTIVALTPVGELIEEFSADGSAVDADGWSSRTLAEGPIEVLVTGGTLGYCSQRAAALILANSKTQLELKLEPALRVRVRLDPPPDESWKGHSVFLVEPKNWADVSLSKDRVGDGLDGGPAFPYRSIYERKLAFDSEGVAKLQCVGPGKYRFKVLPDDIALDPDSIDLERDSDDPIVVRWKR